MEFHFVAGDKHVLTGYQDEDEVSLTKIRRINKRQMQTVLCEKTAVGWSQDSIAEISDKIIISKLQGVETFQALCGTRIHILKFHILKNLVEAPLGLEVET